MTLKSDKYDRPIPLTDYIEKKIDMLENEFCLRLSAYERIHMRSLTTESSVDLYARQLIAEKL